MNGGPETSMVSDISSKLSVRFAMEVSSDARPPNGGNVMAVEFPLPSTSRLAPNLRSVGRADGPSLESVLPSNQCLFASGPTTYSVSVSSCHVVAQGRTRKSNDQYLKTIAERYDMRKDIGLVVSPELHFQFDEARYVEQGRRRTEERLSKVCCSVKEVKSPR